MQSRVFIAEEADIASIARALDSKLRRKMLALLASREMNVGTLALEMGIPQSTCTVNLQVLERAKLVETEQVAASKGSQKICRSVYDEIVLPLLASPTLEVDKYIETEMPIGLYTDFSASPPCGLVSSTAIIGYYDHADSFLDPHRASAALIWIASGYLEYRFPRNAHSSKKIVSVSLMAEVCSEFPGYKTDWPSDITVWINKAEVGTWTSPGDMGGERGRHTPEWWDVRDSQFGFLKTWKVGLEASYIDGVQCSGVRVSDLDIDGHDSFKVRIGVKEGADNFGGLNLFGNGFGNYRHGLILRIELAD